MGEPDSTVGEVDEVGCFLLREAEGAEAADGETSWVDKLSPGTKLIYGFGASVLSGCLYGVNFNPPIYGACWDGGGGCCPRCRCCS